MSVRNYITKNQICPQSILITFLKYIKGNTEFSLGVPELLIRSLAALRRASKTEGLSELGTPVNVQHSLSAVPDAMKAREQKLVHLDPNIS